MCFVVDGFRWSAFEKMHVDHSPLGRWHRFQVCTWPSIKAMGWVRLCVVALDFASFGAYGLFPSAAQPS